MDGKDIWDRLQYYFNDFVLFRIQNVGITASHLFVASVAVILALLVSKIVRRLLRRRLFSRMALDQGIEYAVMRFVHYLILTIGVYIGLKTINIPLGAFIGLFAVIGVGIGFGLQNIASNFISGVILLMERPIKVGDRLEIGDVWGDVTRIDLRTTIVTTPDDIAIIVPNSKLLENNVVNYSYGDRKIRLHIPIGIAYGSDVEKATQVLTDLAREHKLVLPTPEPMVWFREFGDSSLNFELLCWIGDASDKYQIISDLNRAIDRRFREENIEIPFPQRDLHLRSAEAEIRMRDTAAGN